MNRVLSGREEILRVERRLYTDSMSSVMKSLTALEHKFEDMHSRELISENRFSHYLFDLLRIRCSILHGMMHRDKAFELLDAMSGIAAKTDNSVQYALLAREQYRLRSDSEVLPEDERILRESFETFMMHGELLHAFKCAMTLAQHAQKTDKYDLCLNYLQKAKEIQLELPGEPFLISQIQLGMGNFNISIQDFDKADEYLQEAIQSSRREGNWRTELVALSNIASIALMKTQKKPEQALDILNDCIAIAKKRKANHDLSRMYVMAGSALSRLGAHKQALESFHEAGKLYKKYPFPLHEATLHYKLARLFMEMKSSSKNRKIEHHFQQAHSMTEQYEFLQLRVWVLRHWGLWLRERKQWQRAFTLLHESYKVQNAIIGKEAQRNIKDLEIQYVASLHQKENELLKKQNHELGKETKDLRNQLLVRTSSIMKELNRYGEVRSKVLEILEQHGTKTKVLKEISTLLLPLSGNDMERDLFFSEFHQTFPGFQTKLESLIPEITIKESEVCMLIKSGFSTYQIATFLDISTRTVETHRLNIRKKAGLHASETIDGFLSSIEI
ncbi:MAG: tetratricopeptide repeat protein [Candidatus Kapaibacteriota bacterium]